MNILQSLILGIVEGLTEFLPISSTFHLIVASRLLALKETDFLKLFEVVIQAGAISALLFIYLKELLSNLVLMTHVFLSFVPTALAGLLLYPIIKSVFFTTNWLMLTVFIIMGIIFLVIERSNPKLNKECQDLTPGQAILIGLAQACSIVPGVSRAGAVIVVMILLGYKRVEAAKYTFLLSLPTIFAASALDLYAGRQILLNYSDGGILLATGFAAAFITAYLVVKWLIKYLSTHTLDLFGWYRLGIGALLIFFKVLA